MSLVNILTGWGNLIKNRFDILPEQIKKEGEKRLLICDTCPLRTGNNCDPSKIGINIETGQERRGCGCKLSAKALDPNSECPLSKWKKYEVNE